MKKKFNEKILYDKLFLIFGIYICKKNPEKKLEKNLCIGGFRVPKPPVRVKLRHRHSSPGARTPGPRRFWIVPTFAVRETYVSRHQWG